LKAIKIYLEISLLRLLGEVPPHESARLHEVGVQLALHLFLHPPPKDTKIYLKQTVQHRQCCGTVTIYYGSGSDF